MSGLISVWLIALMVVSAEFRSWSCQNGFCQQTLVSQEDGHPSLELCELVCNNYLNIWPQPTGSLSALKNLVHINSRYLQFDYNSPESTKAFLSEIVKTFTQTLRDSSNCPNETYSMVVTLNTANDKLDLNLNTDESYEIKMEFEGRAIIVNIYGASIYGIRHGLETLFQLIVPYELETNFCLGTVSYAYITDKPVYRHRGLLIDTARNFLSVDTIKRNIDGMASSKLNVLHWHITDSQSFPLESRRLPNMTRYGAYDSKKIYSPDSISDLVKYAKHKGVRILLEIDGPSHASFGWQWGPEAGIGNLAVCINQQPWRSYCIQPPCGQLNPANPHLYGVLNELYKDVTEMFPDSGLFHMGGDEVFIPCWNSSKDILDYLKGKPLTDDTFLDLWADYQTKNLNTFDSAIGHNNTSIVIWTSHLTQPSVVTKYLSKDRYIIQTWVPKKDNSLITDLLSLGYNLIVSTKDSWYLDHGFWGTTSYYKWEDVYNNEMYSHQTQQILGGEVCMWGELVDDNNVESRIWPRAAAAAERLWSNPTTSATAARDRFYAHRERLVTKGIQAEAVTPRWCVQNPGQCNTYL